MSSVLRTLREADPALINLLAAAWSVRVEGLDHEGKIDLLNKTMQNRQRAEAMWDALDDKQRGAMLMLISNGARMPENKFSLLFGKIRKMAPAQIARDKPHEHPSGIAESLYYRGLIAQGYESDATGPRTIIFVPDDLIDALPIRKTSYTGLDDEAFDESIFDEGDEDGAGDDTLETPTPAASTSAASTPQPGSADSQPDDLTLDPIPQDQIVHARAADTSIIDDMTTLLAYLQINAPILEHDFFGKSDLDALIAHLLIPERTRAAFIYGLGVSADLIEIQTGHAIPNRAELRRWLSGTRAEQLAVLANAWRSSTVWIDLFHVPGLHPEPEAGTLNQYNPAAARTAALEMMADIVPPNEWWSVDDLIDLIRDENPDFQRPNGDFDSWYIRSDDGDYLSGMESWDAVEGALLDYYITTPLHWLGMVDSAQGAARLTAYGRGFLGIAPFPSPADPPENPVIGLDGVITVSRKVSRMDRFQVSRFATWGAPADVKSNPYSYRLDARSIARATQQGIDVGHITAFLSRFANPLPPAIANLLENWQGGASASVSFERVLIVRAMSSDIMDRIVNTPETRRFLGARLGELAAIIRAEQADGLRETLNEMGIQVEGLN
jgi:hypothetical protein